MRYPVVDLSAGQEYVLGRREKSLSSSDLPEIRYRGDGDDCVDEIDAMWAHLESIWVKKKKAAMSGNAKDGLEGEMSGLVYDGLKDLPAETLTDRDFWRYLSTTHFFDFTQWRDGLECDLRSFGCARANPGWDCVPLRMFNRALISVEGNRAIGGKEPMWGAKVAGTDLWRSHILRVLNGNAPVFVTAILRQVEHGNLPTDVLREFATGVRRIRANVLFELLDEGQAEDLVDAERKRAASALNTRAMTQ